MGEMDGVVVGWQSSTDTHSPVQYHRHRVTRRFFVVVNRFFFSPSIHARYLGLSAVLHMLQTVPAATRLLSVLAPDLLKPPQHPADGFDDANPSSGTTNLPIY